MTTALEPELTAGTVLLVDDEAANLDLLEALLRRQGFTAIVRTSDARQAVPLFEATRPDVVLLDLHMPHRSGFDLLADLRLVTPDDEFLPVLVLTADVTMAAKQRALQEGAHDFVTKPFVNAEVVLRVRNLLRTRALHRAQRAAREAAEAAERRARLLAEASRVLASSLDTGTALAQLARLLVPDVADRCAIELLDDEGADGGREASVAADAGAPVPDGAPADRLDVPLVAGTATVGWLRLARRAPPDGAHPPFDDAERALAAELAQRAALAVEYARAFLAARATAEERERILAVVAHDLRTPLCALLMDAEMLEVRHADTLGDSPATTVRRIHRTATRMNALIEDLLEVTRVDRGALALERRPHAVADLLAEAAAMLRPLAESAGLALEVDVAPGLPPVDVDDGRLLQVVANLVGNAVKFTPAPGRVAVAAADVGGECRLTVRDSGPGVPAEQLPHLFGAFWQARHADRRGLGLGLAIARGIVEAHGGRIWAEGEPGGGTAFVVALPYAADPAAPAAADPT